MPFSCSYLKAHFSKLRHSPDRQMFQVCRDFSMSVAMESMKESSRFDLEVPLATASLSWPPPLAMAAPVETPVNFPRSGPSTALAEPRAREGCCVSLSSPISSLVSKPAGSPPVGNSQSSILGKPHLTYFENRFGCMPLSKLPGRMHNSPTHCALSLTCLFRHQQMNDL